MVGGTASEIGGGKFTNGAISGAFVHMFNEEGDMIGKIKSLVTEVKAFLHRVEELAQINKAEYNASIGKIETKGGTIGSGILALENANKNYLSSRSSFSKPIYTGLRRGISNAISGGGSGYAGTSLLRTVPALLGTMSFVLGQEFGHYAPAYVQAWYER